MLQDYQKRMVEEFKELNDRTEKFKKFIDENPIFKTMELHKQKLQLWQYSAMDAYRSALRERCFCEGFDP